MNWEWINKHHPEDRELYEWRYILAMEDKADLAMDDLKRKLNRAWNHARRRNVMRRMQKLEQRMKAIHSRKLAWKLANG